MFGFGVLVDVVSYSVGRKDDNRTFGDFVQLVHEDDALGFQGFHHIAVVDYLMAHIDGGAKFFQCLFHHMDGAVHSGAESTGGR